MNLDRLEFELDELGRGKVSINGIPISINGLQLSVTPYENITTAVITMQCQVKGSITVSVDRREPSPEQQQQPNLTNDGSGFVTHRRGREFL